MGKAEMTEKARIRVKAGSSVLAPVRPAASYLRDTRSGVINTRPAILRESRDDIAAAWRRSAGLALDLIQNSGRLRGAADQVIADTVGSELVLNPQPDLSGLGYDDAEKTAFVKLLKAWWKRWSWNPRECDLRGKLTVPQMIDVALRWDMAFGEVTGVMSYMGPAQRRQYGVKTGTKVCMIPPSRLVQDTSEFEGMFQGVIHDALGRPVAYRFREKADGIVETKDYRAFDGDGRPQVIHIFDPMDATDVRGISRMAAGFRKHIQHEILVDTTIQTAILQTIFAATLTSASPSAEAFEAIETLQGDAKTEMMNEFMGYFAAAMERARDGQITVSGDPRISHLAPGESFDLHTAQTPGPQFLPVSAELSRDMARAIGITYGGLTMDHTDATYSSVRMENSSIWPVVLRRRERIAGATAQMIYENALDEEIGSGRIPFKGGYAAFAANRDKVSWALWQGPAKPSADDLKSAKAATERLANGTSDLEVECAEIGVDAEEMFERRQRQHNRYIAAGMPSPFVRATGGGKDDSTEETPAKAKEKA
jgi:lambda family phage portal protein